MIEYGMQKRVARKNAKEMSSMYQSGGFLGRLGRIVPR